MDDQVHSSEPRDAKSSAVADSRAEASPPKRIQEHDSEGKDPEQQGEQDEGVFAKLSKHLIVVSVSAIVAIGIAIAATLWYLDARHYESTDDAFIDGRPVSINLQETGSIVSVPVTDNQVVKAGDLLIKIDDRDYRAAVNLAQAQIAQAEANIAGFSAQIHAQEAQIEQAAQQVIQATATLDFSKDENTRYQELVRQGAGTVQRAQQSASDLGAKGALQSSAQAAKIAAERQISVLAAQQKNAEGQLDQANAQKAMADANLSRTELRATVEGRVTRLTAAVGQLATPAQAVMILVPLEAWVTANFKETQLEAVRVGQSVDIEIDAFGQSFPGHVDSVQSGSGTAFSLLPAQNATGNYVKVVQRIPVKIKFDRMPDVQVGPGMSVFPKVKVR